MKLIPITGLIHTILGPIQVEGFAFQVPGFEWCRTWATPQFRYPFTLPPTKTGKWVVSEWITGRSIAGHLIHEDSPEKAAESIAAWFEAQDKEALRKRYRKAIRRFLRGHD